MLTDAIDSATLAGVSTDGLQSELCDISRRMHGMAEITFGLRLHYVTAEDGTRDFEWEVLGRT